jgi:hypothetical protein
MRRPIGCSLVVVAISWMALSHGAPLEAQPPGEALRLLDLDGRDVDPMRPAARARARVFVFTSIDCPISNRYAPELRRLFASFSNRGVRFHLVYPNPVDTADAIRAHLAKFGYAMTAFRDPRQALVRRTGASVTPEVALFDEQGELRYRGRIDDRYVAFGVERPAPTRRDLHDALMAVLEGREVAEPTTEAIGCFLADMIR